MANKNILMHPIVNGQLDTSTNLYPKTIIADVEGLQSKITTYDGYQSQINAKSTVSGTSDGNNWITITIDGTQKAIPQGITSVTWGSITGTLSNQTDLQSALNDKENSSNKTTILSDQSTDIQYPSAKAVYDADQTLQQGLNGKANLAGGNTFTGNQQFNDLVYLEGSTPFVLSKQGKIGMRATNASNENLGQINVSNAWYDATHYGVQMNAKNVATGKYNAIRVSHNGPQYFDENDTGHNINYDLTNVSQLTNDAGYITSQAVADKEDKSNKVSSWSSVPTHVHYPSEKLVKDSLDTKSTVSGSYSGNNWTSITINGNTRSIPQGGGGSNTVYRHTFSCEGSDDNTAFIILSYSPTPVTDNDGLVALFRTALNLSSGVKIVSRVEYGVSYYIWEPSINGWNDYYDGSPSDTDIYLSSDGTALINKRGYTGSSDYWDISDTVTPF